MKAGKALRGVAVALVGALALTACGGGDDAGDSGPAKLRMTVWSANEAHLKLFNEIADEYKKSHPDVESITFDPLPFENYTTTLTTQIAGGNAPTWPGCSRTRPLTSCPPAHCCRWTRR